jgi:hypothetical protein
MMAMFIPPPIVAIELDDILKLVFLLIIGVFWLVKQLMGQEAAKPKRPAPPKIPPPVRPAAGQAPLQDEVAEFLRQARQRKGHPQEARVEVREYQPPAAKKKRSAEKPPKGRRARELKERHDVDEHVRDRLDTSKFGQRAEQLGDLVEASEQQFQEHVQEKFSHDLGRLGQSGTADAAGPGQTLAAPASLDAPASALAELLRRPESMRQAIILQEILRRPSERS